jgi:alpha-ketoglutarate-dependent taurine dioxygenase
MNVPGLPALPAVSLRAGAGGEPGGLKLHDGKSQRGLTAALLGRSGAPSFFSAVRDAIAAAGFALARMPGFAQLAAAEQDMLAVAVAGVLGQPSPVGSATEIIVWDVRPRPELSAAQRAHNISVSDGEACLHTDSAFSDAPERWFALWCVRPAHDGGESVLVDAAAVIGRMAADPSLRPAVDTLMTHDVPIWDGQRLLSIRALRRDGDGKVAIRYRADLLREGLRRAELDPRDPVAEALRTLTVELDDEAARVIVPLKADDLLIVDNHRVLHARQHFTDPGRHLLRVRMHDASTAARRFHG